MAYPVVHFEVAGKDLAKLKSFYTELFDWKTQDFDEPGAPPYAMVEKAEGGIAGGIGAVPDGGNGHVTFYVAVADPQATLDKAVSLGGSVVMPVTGPAHGHHGPLHRSRGPHDRDRQRLLVGAVPGPGLASGLTPACDLPRRRPIEPAPRRFRLAEEHSVPLVAHAGRPNGRLPGRDRRISPGHKSWRPAACARRVPGSAGAGSRGDPFQPRRSLEPLEDLSRLGQ